MNATALEFKDTGEGDDAVAIVTKSLEDFTLKFDDRLKAMEAKSNDNRVADRLSKIEAKMSLPTGTGASADDTKDIETKAVASFMRTGSDLEMKAAATDSNPDGGWMVLPTVDMRIRTLMTDLSPMRGLAEVVSISGGSYERFYSMGKRGAQRVVERDDRPSDTARPELIKQKYEVGEYYACPAATRHLLDDAAVDIASWLIDNTTRDFSATEGEDFLRYDGSNGFPRGLLTYDFTSEKDFTREWGKFQYVPAGHASAPTDGLLADALVDLESALRKPYKGNACFVMNTKTATRLRKIKDADGRYLWAPTGNLIEGIEHPLLGYSVVIDDGFDDIGAGKFPIAFGDFRQGYVIVDRQGIRVERDSVTQKGKVLFDTYKRIGGGAGDFNAIKFLKIAVS
jgi:HK97 family phage major capsid protein